MDEGSHIDALIKSLPDHPGIYQFLNRSGQVIYVGKAKNLKKRVSSYFGKKKFEKTPIKQQIKLHELMEIVP